MSISSDLIHDKYTQAALSVGGLLQPDLSDLAWYLKVVDVKRFLDKGKWMTSDHLKQEAQKWAKG